MEHSDAQDAVKAAAAVGQGKPIRLKYIRPQGLCRDTAGGSDAAGFAVS
jgi:hypothetical protein